ncbi:hypothetical protein [Streptomyces parvus]
MSYLRLRTTWRVFLPYPLEGPQDGDLVCRATAAEALPALVNLLGQQAG